jgi:Nucleoside 2-deoxyribosyltransferase like
MDVHYAGNRHAVSHNSLFLAGPTPRDRNTPSWRPDALEILRRQGFGGVVYVPEPEAGPMGPRWPAYDAQCEWEQTMLDASSCIVFWIPREMATMPALTTNVEFGLYARSGKLSVGWPHNAAKNNYISFCCRKWGIVRSDTLEETLAAAQLLAGKK